VCVQVVVPKRTALLLDKIMMAFQKAVDDEKGVRNYAPNIAENKVCTGRLIARSDTAAGT